jgi:ubiquinone biosynthesis protein UbiJ
MLFEAVLGFLNHLLIQEDWPRNRLRSFPGQVVRLEIGRLVAPLSITPDGLFALASSRSQATVTLSMPASALFRGLTDRASVLPLIKITGSAELADILSVIFRTLRWDVESDLAPLLGDIAAHRLAQGGSSLLTGQRQLGKKVARNLAQTLTDSHSGLPSRQQFSSFSADLAALEAQLARVDARVARLEQSPRVGAGTS